MGKKKQRKDAVLDGSLIWERSELARPGMLEHALDDENLLLAMEVVRQVGAAPGPDRLGITDAFEAFEGSVDDIVSQVRRGRYVPGGVRLVQLTDQAGRERTIGVPNIQDRILQQALLQQAGPRFDAVKLAACMAGSRQRVVQAARALDGQGQHFVARIFLSRQPDSAQRRQFVDAARRFIEDERVVQVLRSFIRSGIMAEGAVAEPDLAPGSASPLMLIVADMYLDALDHEMSRRGTPLVRYSDEILVFAPSERGAQLAQSAACQFLRDRLKASTRGKETDILPSTRLTTSL